MSRLFLITLLLAFTCTVGCGEHEDHDHDHENNHQHDANNKDDTTPSEHEKMACMAFSSATPSALTASADVMGAGTIKLENATLFEVTLPESGLGYVSLHGVKEHTDMSFFTESAESFTSMMFNGEKMDLPTAGANRACETTLKGTYVLHMHEDGMAIFGLKGAPNSTVKVMLMGAESDHAGHDHKN